MAGEKQLTILTIEDEGIIRRTIVAFLENRGYRVIEAENGRRGLEEFDKERPDLVLLDLRMPEVDGLEVLNHIKDKVPEVPVIIVSGTGVIADVVEAIRMGAWDYILKPIQEMGVLQHVIEKAFERVRIIKENVSYKEHLEQEVVKRTEELNSSYKALQESEEKFRVTFEQAPDGMALVEPGGTYFLLNDKFCDIVGYSRDELLKKTFKEITHEEDVDLDLKNVERLLAGQIESFSMDKRYIHKNGYIIWVSLTVSLVKNPSGEPNYFVSIVKDITEKRNAEKAIENSQKFEAIAGLSMGLSHEIKNPLSIIKAHLDVIKEDKIIADRGDLKENFRIIEESEKRIVAILDHLATLSKSASYEPRPTDIVEMLHLVLNMLSTKMSREEICFSSNLDELAPIIINVDPGRMIQLFSNLMFNSIESMRKITDEKRISVELLSGTTYVEVRISDSGAGIATQDMGKVFDPFFSRKHRSAGMGLSICQSIVNEHSGKMKIDSKEGAGTVVRVLLPTR